MKKSLTFIFAAALWYLANRKRTKRRLLQTVVLLSRLLSHALPKLTLKPEIKLALQSSKTVTSYMRKIN